MDMSLQSAKPFWWEAAPREPETDATLPSQCDCLVVGAGYAGLSAALRLAEAGRDVVVCDAGPAGFGGSSRSGGMIGHGHRLSYGMLIKKYGQEKARALVLEGMASLDYIKDLIRSRGLNAELQEVGRLRGAWTASDYDLMGREADFCSAILACLSKSLPKPICTGKLLLTPIRVDCCFIPMAGCIQRFIIKASWRQPVLRERVFLATHPSRLSSQPRLAFV